MFKKIELGFEKKVKVSDVQKIELGFERKVPNIQQKIEFVFEREVKVHPTIRISYSSSLRPLLHHVTKTIKW